MWSKIKEPLMNFNLKEVLKMTDIYTLIMLSLYSILSLIFFTQLPNASNLILTNLLLALAVVSIATIDEKFNTNSLFKLFRKTYIIAVIFIIYSQVQPYLRIINPHDYDKYLIAWDLAIFGFNPTQALQNFSNKYLTEYFQFAYMTFFFMPLLHGIELHYSNEDKKFGNFIRMIIFQFYISYLLYFVMPAVGPRFSLHIFSNLSNELPGVWLTDFFRLTVNLGGNVPINYPDPASIVNRDCMPSGHTMITIANIIMVFRDNSRFKWMILIFGVSLIFSTIYLRYHYVVDLIAGAIFALICLWLEPKVRSFFKDRFGFTNS